MPIINSLALHTDAFVFALFKTLVAVAGVFANFIYTVTVCRTAIQALVNAFINVWEEEVDVNPKM